MLEAWQQWGRRAKIHVDVMTHSVSRARPFSAGSAGSTRGHRLPVIVGLAGPATPATLMKFALRCGIGNSMRAVRSQIGRFGRLLTDTGPDEVMRGLQSAPEAATAPIAGFHLFPFGGLRKSADWLRDSSARLTSGGTPAERRLHKPASRGRHRQISSSA